MTMIVDNLECSKLNFKFSKKIATSENITIRNLNFKET